MALEDAAERQQRVFRSFPRQRVRSIGTQDLDPHAALTSNPSHHLSSDELEPAALNRLGTRGNLKRHFSDDSDPPEPQAGLQDDLIAIASLGKRVRRNEALALDAISAPSIPAEFPAEYLRPNAILNFLVGSSLLLNESTLTCFVPTAHLPNPW